jgi:hypothetical protein
MRCALLALPCRGTSCMMIGLNVSGAMINPLFFLGPAMSCGVVPLDVPCRLGRLVDAPDLALLLLHAYHDMHFDLLLRPVHGDRA